MGRRKALKKETEWCSFLPASFFLLSFSQCGSLHTTQGEKATSSSPVSPLISGVLVQGNNSLNGLWWAVWIMWLFLENHVWSWVGKADFLKEGRDANSWVWKRSSNICGATWNNSTKWNICPHSGHFKVDVSLSGGGGQQMLVEYQLWGLSQVLS